MKGYGNPAPALAVSNRSRIPWIIIGKRTDLLIHSAEQRPIRTDDVQFGFDKKGNENPLDCHRPVIELKVGSGNLNLSIFLAACDAVSIIFRVYVVQRTETVRFSPSDDLIADLGIEARPGKN